MPLGVLTPSESELIAPGTFVNLLRLEDSIEYCWALMSDREEVELPSRSKAFLPHRHGWPGKALRRTLTKIGTVSCDASHPLDFGLVGRRSQI